MPSTRSPGPTRSSSSIRRAPTTRRNRQRGIAIAGDRAHLARLRRTEELRRVDGDPRLDSVARRRRAGDAGPRSRDAGAARSRLPCMRLTGCRASPGIWAGGSGRPTGIPTISCDSTIDGRPNGPGRYVHEAVTVRGTVGRAARRASALRVSRHRRSPRDDRPLHDVCRPADARERPPRRLPAARLPSSAGVSAQLPAPRRHAGRRRRPRHLR